MASSQSRASAQCFAASVTQESKDGAAWKLTYCSTGGPCGLHPVTKTDLPHGSGPIAQQAIADAEDRSSVYLGHDGEPGGVSASYGFCDEAYRAPEHQEQ